MISGDQAKGFLQYFLGVIDNEFSATRKIIAAVPQTNQEWRPDPKARTAMELAWHTVTAEKWFIDGIVNGGLDMSGGEPAAPKTIQEIVQFYDKSHQEGIAQLKSLSGEQLAKLLPFFGAMQLPAVMFLNFLMLHSAHHRGQLSVYLRPMGGKVPAIYGGSADEPFQMPAQA
jgi:uncharacterized damage-inducible protein DinB